MKVKQKEINVLTDKAVSLVNVCHALRYEGQKEIQKSLSNEVLADIKKLGKRPGLFRLRTWW